MGYIKKETISLFLSVCLCARLSVCLSVYLLPQFSSPYTSTLLTNLPTLPSPPLPFLPPPYSRPLFPNLPSLSPLPHSPLFPLPSSPLSSFPFSFSPTLLSSLFPPLSSFPTLHFFPYLPFPFIFVFPFLLILHVVPPPPPPLVPSATHAHVRNLRGQMVRDPAAGVTPYQPTDQPASWPSLPRMAPGGG